MDYQYEPLESAEHIRVLLLTPAEDADAPLQCSFEIIHIDGPKHHYDAISYTWDNQKRDQDLHCEGTIIKITLNLSSALRRFRSRFKIRKLWADAVCINQEEDTEEKGLQIRLMSKIYRSAERVRVWLGDGEEQYTLAIDLLTLVARLSRPGTSHSSSFVTWSNKLEITLALEGMEDVVQKFFELSWFSRRWIVQELVLNNNVIFYYGQSKIPWAAVHLASGALPAGVWHGDSGVQIRRRLWQFGNLWRAWCYSSHSETECDFLSLMCSFIDLKCKEDKDIIYAIAGLANDVGFLTTSPLPQGNRLPLIVLDYGAEDNDVFQRLALELIQSGKVTRTLAIAAAHYHRDGSRTLGSWVPDFRCPRQYVPIAIKDSHDFELLDKPESINGKLRIKIRIWSWQRKAHLRNMLRPIGLGSSQRHAGPSLVKELYALPKVSGRQELQNCIRELYRWMWDCMRKSGYSYDAVFHFKFSRMLRDLVTSQKIADYGARTLNHLDSPGAWEQHISGIVYDDQAPDPQWAQYLGNAFSTRKFLISEISSSASLSIQRTLIYGAGPPDLQINDCIFTPSGEYPTNTALFLRSEEDVYRVIGDGYVAYAWPKTARLNNRMEYLNGFEPSEVEIFLA